MCRRVMPHATSMTSKPPIAARSRRRCLPSDERVSAARLLTAASAAAKSVAAQRGELVHRVLQTSQCLAQLQSVSVEPPAARSAA